MPTYSYLLPEYPNHRNLPQNFQDLGLLSKKGAQVTPIIIVDDQTLKEIAKKNHLLVKTLSLHNSLSSQSQHKHLLSALSTHIRKQLVPYKISNEIFKIYHQELLEEQVKISSLNYNQSDSIITRGDNNLIQSILDLWSDLSTKNIETIIKEPATIADYTFTIEMLPQKIQKGTAYTTHHKKNSPNTPTIVFENQKEWWELDLTTKKFTTSSAQYNNSQQTSSNSKILYKLAQLLMLSKEIFTEEKKLDFYVYNNQVYINDVHTFQQSISIDKNLKRKCAVLQRVNTTKQLNNDLVDGIVFSSDYTFASFGIHPISALKLDQKRKILQNQLENAIYQTAKQTKSDLFLYKAYDINQGHLQKMHYVPQKERFTQINPMLGMRGALHLVHHPQVITFQIDVLQKVMQKLNRKTEFIIPMVRNISEFIKIKKFLSNDNIGLWIEVGTPQMLLQPQLIIKAKPKGIIVDVQMLTTCLGGFDSGDDYLNHFYLPYLTTLTTLLHSFATILHKEKIDIYINLKRNNISLISSLLKEDMIKVISPPHDINQTIAEIYNYESRKAQSQN